MTAERFKSVGRVVWRNSEPSPPPLRSMRLGFAILEVKNGIEDAEGVAAAIAAMFNAHWSDDDE